jgi:hypothetical protein
VFPGKAPDDVVLSIENGRAVIAGDTLVDFGQGLEIPSVWLGRCTTCGLQHRSFRSYSRVAARPGSTPRR